MLESLTENRRLKANEDVNFYLKSTGKDMEYLFCLAYQAYYGKIDVYEVKLSLYRYDTLLDPPNYVRAFLHRQVQ